MIYINQNMFDYQSLTYTASNFRTSEEIEIQASHQAHKEGKERYFLHRLLSKLSMCHMALRYRRAFSPTALSVCHCLLTAIFGSLSRVMNTEPFVQNIIRHSDVRSQSGIKMQTNRQVVGTDCLFLFFFCLFLNSKQKENKSAYQVELTRKELK